MDNVQFLKSQRMSASERKDFNKRYGLDNKGQAPVSEFSPRELYESHGGHAMYQASRH